MDLPSIKKIHVQRFSNPEKLHKIETRGGIVFCGEYGNENGIPMIALHAWGYESSSYDLEWKFKDLIDLGYRVIAPDMPGFGRSQINSQTKHDCRSETNYFPGGPVEIIEDIWKHFKISNTKNMGILGDSWGGSIAISLTLKYPSLIDTLILCQPSYTEHNNELLKLKKQKVLITWFPIDPVHPISLGIYMSKKIPNCRLVKIYPGIFKPGDNRHAWKKHRDFILPHIREFLVSLKIKSSKQRKQTEKILQR